MDDPRSGGPTNHLEVLGATANIKQPLLNMKTPVGKWRLIDVEQWDQDFIDLVEPGYIAFHQGERSGFVAEKWTRENSRP